MYVSIIHVYNTASILLHPVAFWVPWVRSTSPDQPPLWEGSECRDVVMIWEEMTGLWSCLIFHRHGNKHYKQTSTAPKNLMRADALKLMGSWVPSWYMVGWSDRQTMNVTDALQTLDHMWLAFKLLATTKRWDQQHHQITLKFSQLLVSNQLNISSRLGLISSWSAKVVQNIGIDFWQSAVHMITWSDSSWWPKCIKTAILKEWKLHTCLYHRISVHLDLPYIKLTVSRCPLCIHVDIAAWCPWLALVFDVCALNHGTRHAGAGRQLPDHWSLQVAVGSVTKADMDGCVMRIDCNRK